MGFENDVMVSENVNFDPQSAKPHLGQFNADGQIPIGSSVYPFLAPGLLTSSDGSVIFTFGHNSIDVTTVNNPPWTVVTGTTQTAAVNHGYIANNAGQVTITLPTTCAVGDTIAVTGINNATGWKIAQSAGQQVFFGAVSTTLGATGSLTSSATRDAVLLLCVVANTTFNVISSIGNITVA
jgi:hypothetical protein